MLTKDDHGGKLYSLRQGMVLVVSQLSGATRWRVGGTNGAMGRQCEGHETWEESGPSRLCVRCG